MAIQVGGYYVPKEDQKRACPSYVGLRGTYIKISSVDGDRLGYGTYNKKDEQIDWCSCFREKHLEPKEKDGVILTAKGKKIMQKLTPMLKRMLDPQAQTLYKADYLDGDLALTDEGKIALWTLVFDANKEELVKLAQEKLDEEKAEKK